MSTRSVVMRQDKPEPWGRYVHFDGYPTGMGATLWNMFHYQFGRNIERMMKTLIDDHPAGWSSLVGRSFDFKPGFVEYGNTSETEQVQPICYCHGDRNEEEQTIKWSDLPDSWCEWAYVFDEQESTMSVYAVGFESDHIHFVTVHLSGDEPDWNTIERMEY